MGSNVQPASGELLQLVNQIERSVARRIGAVEEDQEEHKRATDVRLTRYENVAQAQTERIIAAVSGLAKLEGMPEQIRDMRRETRDEIKRVEEKVDELGERFGKRIEAVERRVAKSETRLNHDDSVAEGRTTAMQQVGAVATWVIQNGLQIGAILFGAAWAWSQWTTPPPAAPAAVVEKPASATATSYVVAIPPETPRLRGSSTSH